LVWATLNHVATQLTREPASAADDSAESRVAASPHGAAVNPLSRDPAGEGSDGIGDSAASRDVREPTSRPSGGLLYQRADAARRAWSRADVLAW
jgi:hypothetical protein